MNTSLKLYDLQVLFLNSIVSGQASPSLTNLVKQHPAIPVSRRIEIYQDAYQVRMHESITEDFPRVATLVGAERFNELVSEFIHTHVSQTSNLAEYSKEFPKFLERYSRDYYEEAMLDWLEIVSNRLAEPPRNVTLSLDEIQNGVPFAIKKHPATFYFSSAKGDQLIYRSLEGVQIKFIDHSEWLLIQFFEEARTMEALGVFLEQNQITSEQTQTLISDWLLKQIIYCERIEHG